MRFNIQYVAQENKFVNDLGIHYDGLVISGPSLEYYANSFSQAIRNTKKQYFVDAHSFDLYQQKRSHKKYLQRLGVEKQIVQLPDGKAEQKAFVESFLKFQETHVNDTLSEDPLEDITDNYDPISLTPPYFIIDYAGCPIQKKNLEFVTAARAIRPKSKIYAVLSITKEILTNKSDISKICKAYNESEANGVCFSVDGFDSYSDSLEYLEGYRLLIDELESSKKPYISLYSSFLDILLAGKHMEAITHGADSKNKLKSSPGSGGRKVSRLYIPELRKRFSRSDLDYLKKTAPELIKCDCGYCNKTVLQRPDEVSHYMACRYKEVKDYNNKYDHLTALEETHQKYSKKLKAISLRYMERWMKVARK